MLYSRRYQILPRYSKIITALIGKNVLVHNGRIFRKLRILPKMVGYKCGEFILTKAIGRSIHQSARNQKKKLKLLAKIRNKKK